MNPLLQNLIVIALVAACALVMGRRAWRLLRGTGKRCGCEHCPATRAKAPTPAQPAPAQPTPAQPTPAQQHPATAGLHAGQAPSAPQRGA
jgi:hypothetical protein